MLEYSDTYASVGACRGVHLLRSSERVRSGERSCTGRSRWERGVHKQQWQRLRGLTGASLTLKRDTVKFVHTFSRNLAQGPQIPFEQLLQQKQEGRLSSRLYTVHKQSSTQPIGTSKVGKSDFKRQNKNRPTEQSSKKPVPRHRQVLEVSTRYC